ncbi:MAG: hypothetical protein HY840_00780 [Bacteroidetes bacterium]|nr:hypothetical protein [Bacteroidota bacterium]
MKQLELTQKDAPTLNGDGQAIAPCRKGSTNTQNILSPDDNDDTIIIEHTHPKPMQQKRDPLMHAHHKMHHKINTQPNKPANDIWLHLLEVLSMVVGAVLAALTLCEYILKPLWHLIKG